MTNPSSINIDELEKFDKISNEWWDPNGKFKILHRINPVRMSYINAKISQHFALENDDFGNLDILDLGCGGGLVSVPLCKLGANVSGIDASPNNIDVANNYALEQNLKITYIHTTIERLCEDSVKKFDTILCLELIEHVDNVPEFVGNIAKLLKPGGMIILSTLSRTIKSYILSIMVAEYVLGWIPKNTHDYKKFIKPSEIHKLFSKHNISLKELKGLSFNIIHNSWQLTDNVDVNYFAYLTCTSDKHRNFFNSHI